MAEQKRYYFLQLHDDFFSSVRIKKLRKMAGGDTFVIIYLKMQLMAMKKDGVLTFSGLEEDFASELALDLDEDEDNVKLTLAYLLRVGLAETSDNVSFFFPYAVENTKSETASTQRSRECRARQKMLDAPKKEPKTIAERQSSFRAKQVCKENGHVPFIEDYANNKRYNGNYYICFKRDKCQCVICGSNQNLCMHHIDGYDENKPENSCANKMITLCRDCHSKVHRSGAEIPKDILESINYFDEDVTSNEFCNNNATLLQRIDIDIDTDIDIDRDRDIERDRDRVVRGRERGCTASSDNNQKRVRFSPPSVEEVSAYCRERGNGVNAQKFVDYYTANGWKVGRNQMRDWKAAIRSAWEAKEDKPRYGNFDHEEAFKAALERSYGELNDESTTDENT